MTQAEGTASVGHEPPGRPGLSWFMAGVAALCVPAVTVLALAGQAEAAGAVGGIGVAMATASQLSRAR
ncbi:hypothetical protein [Streptomyces olivaceiscleroticus]|uniref:Uncharacterized protein n=1 Tax=Streptomyces olivaceiscleroticus TaxID=68245 RepID=A0ABN0ZQG3_9ACTN